MCVSDIDLIFYQQTQNIDLLYIHRLLIMYIYVLYNNSYK